MYQIKFIDPMTGTVLTTQAESLNDAVIAIKTAKDNLYYRGGLAAQAQFEQSLNLPENNSDKDLDKTQENAPSQKEDFDENEDIDEDGLLYPYGVTLW